MSKILKSKSYVFNTLPLVGTCTESFNNMPDNVLMSMSILLGSVFFIAINLE
jgi:hypothetical protein